VVFYDYVIVLVGWAAADECDKDDVVVNWAAADEFYDDVVVVAWEAARRV